ncbi:MAG: LON peptidase substrate-binding domain-containing protein [Parvibaculaceae bacterium]|nr:LON peptidase substrate-binding domain-containing protein [Parvibaculaceae bacterium]
MTRRYTSTQDLPSTLPLFPLNGVLLLPRAQIPLNLFEQRYLDMFDASLRENRLIGMIQPDGIEAGEELSDPTAKPLLYKVGCAGRITSFNELSGGRIFITLTGVARFRITQELDTTTKYRQSTIDFNEFKDDLVPAEGKGKISRERLMSVLKQYLETHDMHADWDAINNADDESIVNSLSVISPFGAPEKQALLEAKSLEDRNQMLIALTEVTLAQNDSESAPKMQ